jgi:hypothetical protein
VQRGSRSSRRFTAAWVLIIALFCVALGSWGSTLARTIGPIASAVEATPSSTPTGTISPTIVTDYTVGHNASVEALCAELSPRADQVTVESPTGTVLETVRCTGKSNSEDSNSEGSSWFTITVPDAQPTSDQVRHCIDVQSPDGGHIVLDATTGFPLTVAQAAQCTK